LDDRADLRFFARCDLVMKLLMQELQLPIPDYSPIELRPFKYRVTSTKMDRKQAETKEQSEKEQLDEEAAVEEEDGVVSDEDIDELNDDLVDKDSEEEENSDEDWRAGGGRGRRRTKKRKKRSSNSKTKASRL